MSIRIAHEAPLSIFDKVQAMTDYDYALVHLFEENEEYFNKFLQAKKKGREIILDNSIFELGEAFDAKKYVEWIEKLQPDWYIIPDVLEDYDNTMNNFFSFIDEYPDLPGKAIAVPQGKTYEEFIACYSELASNPKVEKIGISFDFSFYESITPAANKWLSMMSGRWKTLILMATDGDINYRKPHHLLGCSLPQEFKLYKDWSWIDSVDTSNPVVHGLKGIRYNGEHGLNEKESVKLFTMIDDDVLEHWDDIEYNIEQFRWICNK